MKNHLRLRAMPLLCWLTFQLLCTNAVAQFPYRESFKNKTVNDFVLGGSAVLTANLSAGADPDGQGYLRLTSPITNQTGYAYAHNAFPTAKGLTISFEFFTYKNPATFQADGISFFLFDASAPSFRAGGTGGALGYTQRVDNITIIPGLSMGYLGVGIDEYGNFSNQNDNKKNGGIGSQPGSIVVRGPGDGSGPTDYVYRIGAKTSDASYNIPFTGFNQRYPDSTHVNYRRLKIILAPGSTLGANRGYTLTVILYKGGLPTPVPVTIIDQHDYPFDAPARLKYGFAASTGGSTNYHEIRGIDIQPAVTHDLLPPVAIDDQLNIICQGGEGMVDITANDAAQNAGGSLSKANIDLDPSQAGAQKTFTDPGKGTYTVNESGLVVFTAESGFAGQSAATYTVADDYGAVSFPAAIQVSVNAGTPPELTVNNPAAVCFPQTVDISSAAVASSSTPGAVLNYFGTLSDANAGTNALGTEATTVATGGTYYISAAVGSCLTVKPVVISVHQPPSPASAGANQSVCNRPTGNLVANNPATGTGVWTQVVGPNTAVINTPFSSNSPLTGLVAGTYTFRWTVTSGVCPASTDDVQVINWQAVTANAGSTQNLCNVSSVQLQGNTPTIGSGVWSQVGSPAAAIQTPSSPTTTVTGLSTGNNYTFRWTLTNGACTNSSQIIINNSDNTTANAGQDRVIGEGNGITLAGNAPATGNTGTWSLQSAPAGHAVVIDNPSDRQTTVGGLNKLGDYRFRWTIANTVCGASNHDEMILSVTSVLPLNFLSFTGEAESAHVQLHWTTANEDNSSHFMIERSTDGRTFVRVTQLPASTLASTVKSYRYRDNIGQVSSSMIFYRIKGVDQNGAFLYSTIVAVSVPKEKVLSSGSTSPNPFHSFITIRLSSERQEKATVRLYDENGRLVYAADQNLLRGENMVSIRTLEGLSNGAYILEVVSENIVYREKVLKK